MPDYLEFLSTKKIAVEKSGFDVSLPNLNPMLFQWQKEITHWALKMGRAAIFADCGLGKGHPPDTPILTPYGFRKLGNIEVGDLVIASDGHSYPITGIYHKPYQQVYDVWFSDGARFRVDVDHLHICRTNNDRQRDRDWRVMSTHDLLNAGNLRYGASGKSRNYDIPIVQDVIFSISNSLVIDPYVIGALLGDGCLQGNVYLSSGDMELIEEFKKRLPHGVALKRKSEYDWRIMTGLTGNRKHPFRQELFDLGILGKRSDSKFIPSPYLYSNPDDRLNLLRGLMDTDGYIMPCGTSQFYSVSKELAYGVEFLIRSLGGIPKMSEKQTSCNGKPGKLCYVVTFSLATHNPFLLKRKAERWNLNPRDNGRWIDRIEPAGKSETICISVDSPDQSYVAKDFIVTHNTPMQLEWANRIVQRTGGNVLILAPLAVSIQTQQEGVKFNIPVTVIREQSDIKPGINITNYDRLVLRNGSWRLDPDQFVALVADESSMLKALSSKRRKQVTAYSKHFSYRLACTATPAPNDYIELGNTADFLGVCTQAEMLSMFFINANKEHTFYHGGKVYHKKGSNKGGQEWRLRHHAESDFFEWLSSWAVCMTKPSDFGYSDDGFVLPELNVHLNTVQMSGYTPAGQLFFTGLGGVSDRAKIRRETIDQRLGMLKQLIADAPQDDQWVIWCGLDKEQKLIEDTFGDECVSIYGRLSIDQKTERFNQWLSKEKRILVSKIKILGFGTNLQQAHRMAFFGLNDSWEQWYQAVRRQWRYLQTHTVDVHVILSNLETGIYENVMRKDAMAARLREGLIDQIRSYGAGGLSVRETKKGSYKTDTITGNGWLAMLGDSCERLKEIDDNSVHLSVYSPPFADLYTYTDLDRDLGNSRDWDEFFSHYAYIIREVLRVTMSGRLTCVHTMDIPAMAQKDGYIGVRDFPGAVIQAYENEGWIFHGRAYIQKNPQAQAIRTHSQGLLFVQLGKDSGMSRPALIDQVLFFRNPGKNPVPITPVKNGEMDNELWIQWAHGIWMGISESDTLKYARARGTGDEKHICPLQLGTIERCIKLYSNPGETVLTPFGGIGSEGYQAVKFGRKAVLCELKPSYFKQLIVNMQRAEMEAQSGDLFSMMGVE